MTNNFDADNEHHTTAPTAAPVPSHPCKENTTPKAANPTIGKIQYPRTLTTVANATSFVTFIRYNNPERIKYDPGLNFYSNSGTPFALLKALFATVNTIPGIWNCNEVHTVHGNTSKSTNSIDIVKVNLSRKEQK